MTKEPTGARVLDARADQCPGPALRLQEFLETDKSGLPFTMLGDHLPSLDSLPLIAARFGWRYEVTTRGGEWEARFTRE